MATAARPCLVDSLLPPKRIRDYSGQVNGMTDAQRWRADVGVTFPQPEDAEGSRNQTADEVSHQPYLAKCGLLLHTHDIY